MRHRQKSWRETGRKAANIAGTVLLILVILAAVIGYYLNEWALVEECMQDGVSERLCIRYVMGH